MIRVACIGVGGQGWFNARSLARRRALSCVCDVDLVALRRAADAFPGTVTRSSAESLFRTAAEFDAVAISAPDHLHAALICQALAAGKHCFCEKPMVRTSAELAAVLEMASQRPETTCLGCQGVYSHRFATVAEYLQRLGVERLREVIAWTERPGAYWQADEARLSVSAVRKEDIDSSAWCEDRGRARFGSHVHPVAWRGYSGFGTGAAGDLGSHLLALPVLAFGFERLANARVVRRERAGADRFSTSLELEGELVADRMSIPFRWLHGDFEPPPAFFPGVRCAGDGILLRFDSGNVYCPEWNVGNAFLIAGGSVTRILHDAGAPEPPAIFERWLAACEVGARLPTDFVSFGGPLMRVLLPIVELDAQ